MGMSIAEVRKTVGGFEKDAQLDHNVFILHYDGVNSVNEVDTVSLYFYDGKLEFIEHFGFMNN